ncbi:ABC-2 type transport system ATP-binding protein [Streptomyces sp. LBL]|uniref:ATP-binding cassette domain-containing protein n=1 Tax=Streptomyces sp. LBL TaxID=2940562 RepID=UPI002476808B|nr:ATP-binding cassette domain-containing protein [Streptomyces sp. LBL]MDH6623450.1 ABC-2 type transport system ATP-binding protein [Streptomyces sp. LBL]
MSTIRVIGLRVRHRRTVALDAVDLDFGPGVHGLLGPNGAGKTSLIRILATVAAPTGGRVELLGDDISDHRKRAAVRRRLGYLPQEFGYYPGFTVREFVAYVAWLKEMPAAVAPAAVERAVARVGLADRIDAKVKTLSGGMIRRVGIAQAIVNDPDVLLLDEPTSGLDPEQRVEFRELLRELGGSSTVLVSTHLVEDVAAACTEVTLVESGRVAYRGTPSSLAALGESALGESADGVADGVMGVAGVAGDNPIERGYTAALRTHRASAAPTTPATPAASAWERTAR